MRITVCGAGVEHPESLHLNDVFCLKALTVAETQNKIRHLTQCAQVFEDSEVILRDHGGSLSRLSSI